MKKKGNLFAEMYRALITPDTAFTKDSVFSVSRAGILILIVALVAGGALLSLTFHQNETMKTLTIEESTRRIEKMMASAPEAARQEAIERSTKQMNSGIWGIQMIAGTVIGSGLWLIVVLETWFLLIILMQFLGGEEQELQEKKHRRSFYLSSYAIIPLAVQDLIKGIVLSFKDPTEIGNVLTLAEYTEATELSFSLLSLLDLPDLPGVLKFLVLNVTNPFALWACAIWIFGGVSIFRIKPGKMVIAVAIIGVVFALQTQLFVLIGGLGG